MAYKFSSVRIIYFFVLAGALYTFGGVLLSFAYFTYGIFVLSIGVFVMWNIWRIYTHTNKSIAYFFDAVKNNDTTLAFPVSSKNKTLGILLRSLNELNLHIQNVKLEAEIREKYYNAIIRQSATGFIVMANCKVELINEAACKLAGINTSSSNLDLIKIKNNRLYEALCSLRAGENTTFKSHNNFSVQLLLLTANEIKTGSRNLMLYAIQDIRQELNEKEIESYQKLISILTHEIMNSLAPLTSISKTLSHLFQINGENVEPEQISDIEIATTVQGLKAIEEQSAGLNAFISNYRKLLKIPKPVIAEININAWIEQLSVLYNEICIESEIKLEIVNDAKIQFIDGDKNLLTQVMVNLINNAIESLKTCEYEKRIQVVFSQNQSGLFIQVGNNGPAIPPEIQDKIFVPFFTTKENGSGIGLSISNQIVKLHRGSLDVFSDKLIGTIFTIKF